jgi:hypothetical protein
MVLSLVCARSGPRLARAILPETSLGPALQTIDSSADGLAFFRLPKHLIVQAVQETELWPATRSGEDKFASLV